MSGVFGICDFECIPESNDCLLEMQTQLRHFPWCIADTLSDASAGVYLGRIGIGKFNSGPQPVHSEDGKITVFLAGEFRRTAELRANLESVGAKFIGSTDEELLLHAYAILGVKCFSHLKGQFVCAIWDKIHQQVIVANDRFALYPTYYAVLSHRLVFAPEVRAVLCDKAVSRCLRDDALAEYFRFQRLLGSKTFFQGVNLLAPATILSFDLAAGTMSTRKYWDFGSIPILPESMRFEEAVEEGARLVSSAVANAASGNWRIGAYLSGGLDSRLIAGLLAQQGIELRTFTFGQPGCRDEYYARRIASAVGAHHNFFPYHDGHWIEKYADLHVQLTEGFHSWLHMHGINMLEDVRRQIDVNVSGLGDLVWPGSDFTPLALINAPDTIAFSSLLFDLYGYKYSWPGITYAEERTLYTEPYQKRLRGLAYDSFVRELEPYENLPPYLRAASFNLTNHFARHLLYHCVFGRSHVEYRLPYFDEDFLSFAYGLPVQLGLERRVQKGIITRYLPTLARIPASADELPVNPDNDTGSWTILMHKLRLRLSRWVTVGRAEHPALYADYENWLRTDLRAWAEAILFDQQTLDRGIFAPAALASLWARHLAGNELWTVGKLASIITFEMTMRSFGR